MAKVTLHPLIRSVSGRIGTLVFYSYRNVQYSRRYVIPKNPDSYAQKNRRNLFAEAVTLWQKLTNNQKDSWNNKATDKMMSGYNLFISRHLHPCDNGQEYQTSDYSLFLSYQFRSHSVFDSGRIHKTLLDGFFPSEAGNLVPS